MEFDDSTAWAVAAIMWFVCLIMIWKFFDQELMRMHIKIITTIIMLPLSYVLSYALINKD